MDLDFAGAEITLEVGHVIHGIPQAEFHIGKQGEILFLIGFIGQCQFIYFTRSAHWDKIGEDGGNAVLFSFKNRVAKTVAAFVVESSSVFGRHPARIPYGIAILDKVVKTVAVAAVRCYSGIWSGEGASRLYKSCILRRYLNSREKKSSQPR